MSSFEQTLKRYFVALDAGDLEGVLTVFADDAVVHSPFLGRLSAREFFPKVFAASSASDITVFDILASTQGQARAVGYFRYDWTLKDGTKVYFDAADVFDFNAEDEIIRMTILYDTHPPAGVGWQQVWVALRQADSRARFREVAVSVKPS